MTQLQRQAEHAHGLAHLLHRTAGYIAHTLGSPHQDVLHNLRLSFQVCAPLSDGVQEVIQSLPTFPSR